MRDVPGLRSATAVIGALSLGVLLTAQADWKAAPAANFPVIGGNLANQRYSTLTKINKANLSRLGGAWMVHTENNSRTNWMQGTPVVIDGTMYMSTGHVWARDAATGALKWEYPTGPITGTANFNRGVAVAEGKVFSAAQGNNLVALDQKTGELVWKTQLATRGTTNAPATYYGGLVYIGVGGGEGGVRGQFGAYDAKTGKEVWKFWTVPGPGEIGNDTWEGDSWKSGGAPVWTHPAIDPDLGMIYVPTGNASPDSDGTERGGDNLFSASVVALDLKTGKYKWHFQEVHHDLWDYDGAAPPVLADITYQGRPRKILMHGNKTGLMYILDRTNGKPLIGVEERPVEQDPSNKTAKTQPFPIGDSFVPTCPEPGSVPPEYKSSCVFAPYGTTPVVTAPGTDGGLSWAPMSYSPQTKYLYVCGTIANSGFELRRQTFDEGRGRLTTAPGTGRGFFRPAPARARTGTFTAMDPTTNKIVWQKQTALPCGSGSGILSTAAGLLFHGAEDGRLIAYDAAKGDELWTFQTGAGADAPVATYEINGEQYVAILAGGNAFMGTWMSDTLWAFKLGGTLPPLEAPPVPTNGRRAEAPAGRAVPVPPTK